MKKIIGIMTILAVSVVLAGCHDGHRVKHKGKYHKGKMDNRLPGDRSPIVPNCAADGPGCRQFNPNR